MTSFSPSRAAATAAAALTLGLASCGNDDSTTTATTATTASSTPAQQGGGAPGGGGGMSQSFADVALNTDGKSAGDANTADVVAAANAFLEGLTADQKNGVNLDFSDNVSRVTWSNFPTTTVARKGVSLKDLGAQNTAAALKLVEVMTGQDGYEQINEVRKSDTWLAANSSGGNSGFGADLYYVAIYGTPSATQPFQIQFGGHHIARNYTYNGAKISVTPDFTGTEPTTFDVDGSTVEPLKAKADALFGMFDALSDDQLASAKLASTYDDLVMGPGADSGKFPDAEGLLVSELDAANKKKVLAAIETYVRDAAPSAADAILSQYESELDKTRISWSGNTARDGENSYLRIDGPSVWIEFVNTRSQSTPNIHYHSVWRDKNNDYGSSNPSTT
jgi:hypothetical protein